nr:serine/threonine-protein phosphatase 6 regulatory ankyrin repeat subunit B [Halyomorpha halys]
MSNIYSQFLKYAVIKKDLEEIKFCLVRGADVNQRISPYNETFLHFTPSIEITNELLLFGADVNARDRYGQTPLYSAIANKKELKVIRALLNHGADINARDINGETPLHCAMIDGKELAIIRELLRHRVDVNAIDNAGKTALHLAVRWGNGTNLEVMKELLEFGADITSNDHPTPLHEAVYRGFDTCAELLIKMIVLKKFDESKGIEPSHYVGSPVVDKLMHFLDKCICEVINMRANKICGNHSLFDFVTKRGDNIKAFYPTNKIIPEEIIAKYPIYFDIILANLKLCSERAVLLEKIKTIQIFTMVDNTGSVVLNIDCVYKIAEYLANEHLSNLIKAFKGKSCKYFKSPKVMSDFGQNQDNNLEVSDCSDCD